MAKAFMTFEEAAAIPMRVHLREEFEDINITISEEVAIKCEELCKTYQIYMEDFMDQWLAYTASNLNGAPPTLDALEKLERKELQNLNMAPTTPKPEPMQFEEQCTTPPRTPSESEAENSESSQSDTPTNTPSQLFRERTDTRSVQCDLGDNSPSDFKDRSSTALTIKINNEDMKTHRFMHDKFDLKRQAINYTGAWIIEEICRHNNLELETKLKDYKVDMVIGGRVYSETPGKLKAHSLFIEGTLENYKGQTIKLDLSHMEKMALFSGQAVVARGTNLKSRFVAKEIYIDSPLALPVKPPALQETLQIVVATGPFTLPDNLLFEPLDDLLTYVEEFKPNILILLGPFLEDTPILDSLNETYDAFFESLVEGLMERLQNIDVKVILIPSDKDVHSTVIYPTWPFKLNKKYDKVILAPNPALIDVDGFLIGASSADILLHISKNEVRKGSFTDRMERLASHILGQMCFYPLYPPDPDIPLDFQLLDKFGMLEHTPHLLIIPSNLRRFIKNIKGCVVVNPERLSKGQVAGTFARVEVRPGETPVCDRVSCQILRV